ncbi:patatin-like phospholipase family protein [Prevotella dentasini]|uniref:patatin-like phospholipase family protein n=1 Tax=Prevotella dentasini TaxID=589537 RepID=UPI000A03445A|nr:patatin-like phospholipase family protein [Prevotella dentasini]
MKVSTFRTRPGRGLLQQMLVALFFLSSYSLNLSAQTPERKKVAVVLCGGGAKGVAHIGVLKVLEKAGIPIDMITGTSMGSLVGGLYAIGYDAGQLDSIVQMQDWGMLLSDKADLTHQSIDDRRKQNTYIISRELSFRGNSLAETGGIIQGKNLSLLFDKLTAGYRDSVDFNRLPIPFACVATDIVDNSEVVWHSGILAQAMRSSMSIPAAFAPVRVGDRVLVDGGLRNNFPVDVARQMGADYVIGVTLSGRGRTADELSNGASVLGQIIDVNCKNKYDENIAATDILIQCNTEGYSAASFFPRAIDTLMVRGEQEAMKHWDKLMALKRLLGLPDDYSPVVRQPAGRRSARGDAAAEARLRECGAGRPAVLAEKVPPAVQEDDNGRRGGADSGGDEGQPLLFRCRQLLPPRTRLCRTLRRPHRRQGEEAQSDKPRSTVRQRGDSYVAGQRGHPVPQPDADERGADAAPRKAHHGTRRPEHDPVDVRPYVVLVCFPPQRHQHLRTGEPPVQRYLQSAHAEPQPLRLQSA